MSVCLSVCLSVHVPVLTFVLLWPRLTAKSLLVKLPFMFVTTVDSMQFEASWLPCSSKRVFQNRKQFGNNSTLGKSHVVVNDVVPALQMIILIMTSAIICER